MIRWVAILVLASGCGGASAPEPVDPDSTRAETRGTPRGAGQPSASAEDSEQLEEEATDEASTETPPVVPAFTKLESDPEKAFPLRAKVRRAGALYESRTGPVLTEGDGRAVLSPVIAIDDDRGGDPRRPRILCVEWKHRIAVHVDAADLATVARSRALIVPAMPIPERVEETTPGVRLAPGEEAEVLDEKAGAVRLRYAGRFLRAEGWTLADRVDVVYEPSPLDEGRPSNAELLRSVDLHDAPGGEVVARIETDSTRPDKLLVRKLGPAKKGAVLVAYAEGEEARAVGWVPRDAVRDLPKEVGPSSYGYGSGSGSRSSGARVRLTPGTFLVGDGSGAVLGVVTREGDFRCDADCGSDEPLVRVGACGRRVSVRARRPR